jgi:hypothetical protein
MAARYWSAGRTWLVSGLGGLPYPFHLAVGAAAGWSETTAAVQPLRALIVWMCHEVNPWLVASLRFGEDSVQDGSSDSLPQRSGTTYRKPRKQPPGMT